MDDVAGRMLTLAPAASADALSAAVLSMSDSGYTSESLARTAYALALNLGLSVLQPPRLLDLAVAATKNESLAPVLGSVARTAAAGARWWPSSDFVRLLLALAKAKGALDPRDRAELLREAAIALTPALGTLPSADIVKLALALTADGRTDLLEATAREAVNQRISGFPAQQLLILTQGLVQGLGGFHELVQSLVGFWAELLKDGSSCGAWDSDDEISKQRKKSEQRTRLTADQLVQLAKVTASAGSRSLVETLGAQLVSRGAKELTDAGKKILEVQLGPEGGLAHYSRRDRLGRAVLARCSSGSRSCSRGRRLGSSSRSRHRRDRDRGRRRSRSRGR